MDRIEGINEKKRQKINLISITTEILDYSIIMFTLHENTLTLEPVDETISEEQSRPNVIAEGCRPTVVAEPYEDSLAIGAPAVAPICECKPCADGRPTAEYHLTCQGKVNAGKMTLKDDDDVCKCKPIYVTISEDERARLERVWAARQTEFEWVRNEEDDCHYPSFQ